MHFRHIETSGKPRVGETEPSFVIKDADINVSGKAPEFREAEWYRVSKALVSDIEMRAISFVGGDIRESRNENRWNCGGTHDSRLTILDSRPLEA